ncbi:RNHCP domain-containing protein [Amycolatopsis nigrescens]|uniref:RNHCP domain-containing protein n=1 Tax=Amycolatopsis nigrescens TaxID=381445 RepID=UPI00036DD0EF|nr:RNHCP domain-containing protein [Amycolatopsis nigrescens]
MSNHNADTSSQFRTEIFDCIRCGLAVTRHAPGGDLRNHCPSCLHSRHTIDRTSDFRPTECLARMTPISIAVLRTGDWRIIHRCTRCDELTSNPIAGDDNQLILVRMAVRPLAQPPFPLETFGDI